MSPRAGRAPGDAPVEAFDVCGPLPRGTTVLEASAGTGKTYTVAALVTRLVAQGAAGLDQMLVVTFGRAASQELRERVRGALLAAERALGDPAAARAGADPLHALLAGVDADEVGRRRTRLTAALADFDAATIATTHQFCHLVLAGLGVAGDTDAAATLVEDLDDLVSEVVDDLYVRGFAAPGSPPPPFDRALALSLGRAAAGDPQAVLAPDREDPTSQAGLRYRFAAGVRRELDRRKRAAGVVGYDDLLSRLASTLEPDGAACQRMRARWSVVLVDEFQDTDPVQWQVLERAFHGHATLVLVGDPKQAIYAFRGGDVVTYLAAASTAGSHSTLSRNHRSDAALVEALQAVLGGAELGDERIQVRPVAAAHHDSRLRGAPQPAPLRLRVVRRDQVGGPGRSLPKVDPVRRLIARDCAADVARLLASGATYDDPAGARRPVVAGDVAVLVGTHAQAAVIRGALADAGVPAVVAGGGSVFATPAAQDWLVLLEALEQPHRSGRVRAAALTDILGRTAADLAEGGEQLTDELGSMLRGWADLLGARGVAALVEVASAEQAMPARLLARVDGERRLTDLRHVGQALHAAAVQDGLGLAALVEWLRHRRDEAATDSSTERTRRLDSDAAAVQVLTLHASKGLQYPVVHLPFAADRWERTPDMLLLHDDEGRRLLDVGGESAKGRAEREQRARAEDDGESLRLLYVGLTRAQSQVVLWWAPSRNTETSALHRLLVARRPGAGEVPPSASVPGDEEMAARLGELAARAPAGRIAVEDAVPGPVVRPEHRPAHPGMLELARFDRDLDTAWRRTSYSALAAAADRVGAAVSGHGVSSHRPSAGPGRGGDGPGVGSEPDTGERDDEVVPAAYDEQGLDGAGGPGDAASAAALLAVPSPMAELPSGTGFGTLVHAVLETADPQAPDLRAELRDRSAEQLTRRALAVTPDALADALLPVLATPLGPLAGGATLAGIPRGDRLVELGFELPLCGGDRAAAWGGAGSAGPVLGDLAPLLRRHLGAEDPLAGYAERIAAPEMAGQALRGYLTGSIDLVLRLAGPGGPRYLVADYKTNWLGDPGDAALTAWHYRPQALDEVMAASDYPLQAVLYCVALHRFLRWRQPGYDPSVHLGGVLYLYLRGMCGAETPVVQGRPCGVFSWAAPPALVVAVSDLLDGARA